MNGCTKYIAAIFICLSTFCGAVAQSTTIKNMRAKAGTLREEIAQKEKMLLSSQKDVKSFLNFYFEIPNNKGRRFGGVLAETMFYSTEIR